MEPKNEKIYFWKKRLNSVDLTKLELTKVALEKVYETISNNGKILFVSTKKQASKRLLSCKRN